MSISKVNIQEANSHLRKLHKTVFELENRIQMQAMHVEELQKANIQLQQQLSTVTQEKKELTQHLEEAEANVQQLLEAATERDATVLKLERKARLFYEVVEHRPAIARILEVLEELSVKEVEGEGGAGGVLRSEVTSTETGLVGPTKVAIETSQSNAMQAVETTQSNTTPSNPTQSAETNSIQPQSDAESPHCLNAGGPLTEPPSMDSGPTDHTVDTRNVHDDSS
jgi:chromosome segregation ATPase